MTNPLHYLDYGALGAAILVLFTALGFLMWTLSWLTNLLAMVLARIEDNTHVLLGLGEIPHDDQEEAP